MKMLNKQGLSHQGVSICFSIYFLFYATFAFVVIIKISHLNARNENGKNVLNVTYDKDNMSLVFL